MSLEHLSCVYDNTYRNSILVHVQETVRRVYRVMSVPQVPIPILKLGMSSLLLVSCVTFYLNGAAAALCHGGAWSCAVAEVAPYRLHASASGLASISLETLFDNLESFEISGEERQVNAAEHAAGLNQGSYYSGKRSRLACPPELSDFESYGFPAEAEPPSPFMCADLIRISKQPLISAERCSAIIREAEQVGGWSAQEFYYALDVTQQLETLPETLAWFNAELEERLFPMLATQYPSAIPDADLLRVLDCKILKYNATAGESRLGTHRDGSLVTFTIALNRGNAYEGGGLFVEELRRVFKMERGCVLSHPGIMRHGGHRVRSYVERLSWLLQLLCAAGIPPCT